MNWSIALEDFLHSFGYRDVRGFLRVALWEGGGLAVYQYGDLVYLQGDISGEPAHLFHANTASFLTACADMLEDGHQYANVVPKLTLETPEEWVATNTA